MELKADAPKNGIDTLLFDLGGVLVEFNDDFQVFEWANMNPAAFFEQWIASPTVRDFEAGRISPQRFAEGVVQEFRLPVSAFEFLQDFQALPKGLYDGIESLLKKLQAKYRLACFSNTNPLHWPVIRDEMKIGALLDECFISYQTGLLKPDPEAFDHVLQVLGCSPGQVVFFDDNPVNIKAALEYGLRAYHVNGIAGLKQIITDLDLL